MSIILPVKGLRPGSVENWLSYMRLVYLAELEYLFIVESQYDPAYVHLQNLSYTVSNDSRAEMRENSHSEDSEFPKAQYFGSEAYNTASSSGASYDHDKTIFEGYKFADNITVKVLVSGPCKKTSQKIHNLLCGVRNANSCSEYILCLDDDMMLHPGTLLQLIANKRKYLRSLLVTGLVEFEIHLYS